MVADEYGFQNVPPPRRGLRVVPEEPPTVVLLKDYFTPGRVGAKESLDDFYVEGMPIPLGETMRVPYLAEGPYGLGQAWFLYRILKKTESGNDVVEEEPWRRLPLAGSLRQRENRPVRSPSRRLREHAAGQGGRFRAPCRRPIPDRILGPNPRRRPIPFQDVRHPRRQGGLREIRRRRQDRILPSKCMPTRAIRRAGLSRGSETRVQTLGTQDSLVRWILSIAQEERRLRELDSKQRTIFNEP